MGSLLLAGRNADQVDELQPARSDERESLPIMSEGSVDSPGQCRVGLYNAVDQGRHDKAESSYYGGA